MQDSPEKSSLSPPDAGREYPADARWEGPAESRGEAPTAKKRQTWAEILPAFLIGLLGSVFIWVATPYNNFILNSAYISDSYLPIAALFVMLAIVLLLNPLLRIAVPRFAMNSRQLAIVFGVTLVASTVPSQGLLRQLPYSLAKACQDVHRDPELAKIYKEMNLRPALFPDKVVDGGGTWITERLLTELLPGEKIPWGAWVPPLLSWGVLLLASWSMMIGLSLIVFPQWRRNERLAFPLLTVQQLLIEDPGEGRAFAPIFRRRSFWIATGAVFVLHILNGMQFYRPDAVPAIPLTWNLQRLFTEQPLNQVPDHIYKNRLYFIFLAVAFFMPSRIGFSVWFFTIVYAVYEVVGKIYFPPYHVETITDQRTGATIAVALGILWLGRMHWAHVFGCLFRRPAGDEDRRDRLAAVMFLAGCAGMFLWFTFYARVQWGWALSFVVFAFVVSLVVTRVVAETGMPYIRISTLYKFPFVHMANSASLTATTIFFSYFLSILYALPSRIGVTTMAAHGIGMDEKASPRHHSRLAWMFIVTLAVGVVISGAAHLWYTYNYGGSIDRDADSSSKFGAERLDKPHKILKQFVTSGTLDRPGTYNQKSHMMFGAALAGLLQWGCLSSPRFPLHAIGLLLVGTQYGDMSWISILIGWFLKLLILRYGGARLYRRAQPFFLGLIMGEVLATVAWAVVPPVLVLLGEQYVKIEIQPQ